MFTKTLLTRISEQFGKKTTVKGMVFIRTEKKNYEAEVQLMKDYPEYSFYFTSEEL